MAVQRGTDDIRRVRPLDTRVHAFCALPEHGGIDAGLVVSTIRFLANVIQRIAGEPDAGPQADIEIEFLPHGYDRGVIDVTLPLELGCKLRLCRLVRPRSNRAN